MNDRNKTNCKDSKNEDNENYNNYDYNNNGYIDIIIQLRGRMEQAILGMMI